MASQTKDVHLALLTRLNEVCSCPVWDKVPQSASYPYVVINSTTVNNMDSLNAKRDDRSVYLSVYSQEEGQAEVMGILGEIEAVHNGTLEIATGKVCSLRVMHSDTNRDADGVTFMGRATLRILTSN